MNRIERTLPLFLSQSEEPFSLVLDSSDAEHLCQDDVRSTRDRVATPFAQPAEEDAHQARKNSGLCGVPRSLEEFLMVLMLHKDRRVVLAPVLSVVEARAGTACSHFAVAAAAGGGSGGSGGGGVGGGSGGSAGAGAGGAGRGGGSTVAAVVVVVAAAAVVAVLVALALAL